MKEKNKNEEILEKLSKILPFLPEEGKERLLARIEGMSDAIEAIFNWNDNTDFPH